jgi:hypothetical protein
MPLAPAPGQVTPRRILVRRSLVTAVMFCSVAQLSRHAFKRPQPAKVDPMAILVREQVLRHDPVFELWWQPPLARHHVVARQVSPEVIMQVLGSAVDFPAAKDIESLAVHDEDAGRPF